MGFRCRWIASRGSNASAVVERLGFEIEETLREPAYDPGLYAVALPTGWVVVIGDGWDYMHDVEPAHARALSSGGETVFFYCDDTPMCAELCAFRDGREVWSLSYDGSDGVSTPDVVGSPPDALSAALGNAEKQQEMAGGREAGVDYLYDVAPEVGLAYVGFRHDQTLSNGEVGPILQLRRR